jgi:nucleotide-binding universal stress UspA family protein
MRERAGGRLEDITRPGELPLGETSGLTRKVFRHTTGDELVNRPHREGGDIAPMKANQEIQEILVAVDFSEQSDQALDAAVEFAKRYSAELHIVHGLDVRIPLMTPYEVVVPAAFIDEARRVAASNLATIVQKVAAEGVTVSSHLSEAPAASAIVDLAKKVGADLIVMGTRGRTGLKHVLLGSVAERTLREAPCSVLTVKGSPN